ncbi:MAG: DNA methyltransferase, partial [Solirubrobacterales bacterium]
IQLISSLINPAAVARKGYFGRSDEYLLIVMLGSAGAQPLALGEDWITSKGRTHKGEIRWDLLRKSGSSPTRDGHPETFYAFFVTEDGGQIHSVGDPIGVGASRGDVIPPAGTFAVWPIRKNGTEGRWRLQPSTVRKVLAQGCLRLGTPKGETTPIYYLAEGEREKIKRGLYKVIGHRIDGSVVTSVLESEDRRTIPSTQWRIPSHDATQYGTRLLSSFLPARTFPYPKSLYAVEDTLRFFVSDKPDAVIIDFFSGSGTTAHAVMRLNRQDDGRRSSICITNNEVSAIEQSVLRGRELRPGDADWEALGICEYVTKPRLAAAVTGETPEGEKIQGSYKFTDEFPMAEGFEANLEFFTMTYESPRSIAHHKAFERIAPLLWLRAGAEGRRIESVSDSFDVADRYGVLFDLDHSREFLTELGENPRARIAFVVTDDDRAFQAVCLEISSDIEAVRLYSSYLTNFEFTARSV